MEEVHALAASYALVPAVSAAALLAYCVLGCAIAYASRSPRSLDRRDVASALSALPQLTWLLLLAFVTGDGHMMTSASVLVFGSACGVGGGVMSVRMDGGVSSERLPRTRTALHTLVACGVASSMTMIATEMAYGNDTFAMRPAFAAIELAVMFCAMAIPAFLVERPFLPKLVAAAFVVFGAAEQYVVDVRGRGFGPADFSAIGTAAEVAGGYSLALTSTMVTSVGMLCLILAVLSAVRPVRVPGSSVLLKKRRKKKGLVVLAAKDPAREPLPESLPDGVSFGEKTEDAGRWRYATMPWAARIAVPVACAAALVAVVTPDYEARYGTEIMAWDIVQSCKEQGLVPSFVTAIQQMGIEAPDGYTDDLARRDETTLAAKYDESTATPQYAALRERFDEDRPSVVAIMNEAYSDLTIFSDKLGETDYKGPYFMDGSEPGTFSYGVDMVSVNGGQTCNTEFEFLTGCTLGSLGADKSPYTMYKFDKIPCLPRQLKGLGYATTAMHPQNKTNWRRNEVYGQMGFDRFIDQDGFADAEVFHNGVSDAATFDRILDVLGDTSSPQFVFDVTMQNHGSYDVKNIPADRLTQYAPANIHDGSVEEYNEYVSCVDESDRALRGFLEELRQLDRPVVLVMFGDHQPGFTATYDGWFYGGGTTQLGSATVADPGRMARMYQTCYIMWANYDLSKGWEASRSERAGAPDEQVGDVTQRTAARPADAAQADAGAQETAAYDPTGLVTPETTGDAVRQGRVTPERHDSSACMLASMMLSDIGAPMTDYQKAQQAYAGAIPMMNAYVYLDTQDMRWKDMDSGRKELTDLMSRLHRMDYYEFGRNF